MPLKTWLVKINSIIPKSFYLTASTGSIKKEIFIYKEKPNNHFGF